MKRTWRGVMVVTVLAGFAMVSQVGPKSVVVAQGASQAAQQDRGIVVAQGREVAVYFGQASGQAQLAAQVRAHWTAAALQNAKPKGLSVTRTPAMGPRNAPSSVGVRGSAGGTKPGDMPSTMPTILSGSTPTILAAVTEEAFPGPHATYSYNPKYRTFPVSTVGKLFYHDPFLNEDHVCSGIVTYADPSVLDMVWTAGHCVAPGDGSGYYNTFLFCPSYDSGQGGVNPNVGCWTGVSAVAPTEWFNNAALSMDYARLIVSPTGTLSPNHIVTAVGGLGLSWNQARDQQWFHFGYPDSAPVPGGKIMVTATERRYDVEIDAYGPFVNSWGSSQNQGSSGSALLRAFNYQGNNGPYINSVVSFAFTSGSNGNELGLELQGPYFDTNTCTFWKAGSGYPGAC